MTNSDLKALTEAVSQLAFAVDRISGRTAGIASLVAHIPEVASLLRQHHDSIVQTAHDLAPSRQVGGGHSPGDMAEGMVRKIAETVSALEASRSAGQ